MIFSESVVYSTHYLVARETYVSLREIPMLKDGNTCESMSEKKPRRSNDYILETKHKLVVRGDLPRPIIRWLLWPQTSLPTFKPCHVIPDIITCSEVWHHWDLNEMFHSSVQGFLFLTFFLYLFKFILSSFFYACSTSMRTRSSCCRRSRYTLPYFNFILALYPFRSPSALSCEQARPASYTKQWTNTWESALYWYS